MARSPRTCTSKSTNRVDCICLYAYPDPPGYRDSVVGPAGAKRDDGIGEFVLPYEPVRTAADPDAVLLELLQSTCEAAAATANWDRPALERPRKGTTDG